MSLTIISSAKGKKGLLLLGVIIYCPSMKNDLL